MIYGVSQPNTSQQRRSFRSFLYTKVIPRSQRAANVSRDNMAAADTQQAPRQDLHPQVGLMYLELLTYIFFQWNEGYLILKLLEFLLDSRRDICFDHLVCNFVCFFVCFQITENSDDV